jgi:hypothetical protein
VFVWILGAQTAGLILLAKKTVNAGVLSYSVETCQRHVNIVQNCANGPLAKFVRWL